MADQNQKPEIFELNNGTMQLLVTNLGCTITSFSVPGKDGSLSLSQFTDFSFFWHANDLMVFCFFVTWRCVIRCCSWPWLCWILSGLNWSKKNSFCDWICFCHWWLCFRFQNSTFFLASRLIWKIRIVYIIIINKILECKALWLQHFWSKVRPDHRHDTNMCDYIELRHCLKILWDMSVSGVYVCLHRCKEKIR